MTQRLGFRDAAVLLLVAVGLLSWPYDAARVEDPLVATASALAGDRWWFPVVVGLVLMVGAFFYGRLLGRRGRRGETGGVLLLDGPTPTPLDAVELVGDVVTARATGLAEAAAYCAANPDTALVCLTPQTVRALAEQAAADTHDLILRDKMEAMGFLTAGIAHDVANPIGFVTVSTENLQADLEKFKAFLDAMLADADAEVVESFQAKLNPINGHLGIILDGCDRIRNITRELQAFARASAEKSRKLVVMDLLENMVAFTKTRFKRRATFVVEGDATAQVSGRAAELNQAFLALLLNAAQAVVRRQEQAENRALGKVHVSVASSDGRVTIRIADDGDGSAPDLGDKAFAPGYSTRTDGGTGMGLTLTRHIVAGHGGTVALHGAPGMGAEAVVVLPAADDTPAAGEAT